MTDSKDFCDIVADVYVNIPAKNICKYYSYRVQPGMQATPGCRVVVPFAGQTVEGVILRLREDDAFGLKEIVEVIGEWFDDRMLQLAWRVSEYYLCSISETLKLFIPGGSAVKKNIYKSGEKKQVHFKMAEPAPNLADYFSKPAQRRLLERLSEPKSLFELRLEKHSAATINTLEKSGAIVRFTTRQYRNSYCNMQPRNQQVELNEGQKKAVEKVSASIERVCGDKYLLYGVTGSGKTEVYLRLAKYAAQLGKQTLALVPEIALTAQLVERFKAFFGERVGVAHSRLSADERRDIFEKARIGEIDILIGARSAVFAPFKSLGLIVVDEEHEYSYKQEDRPYYNAKTVAAWRAEMSSVALVLGSATPAIETWHAAMNGELKLVTLPERATGALLPEIELVDMCEEFAQGNRSMFSLPLQRLLQDTLDKREQAIVLLNRRGYSTFVSCRECGYVANCSACDVSLTYHEKGANLRCHYCGRSQAVPLQCPNCQSPYIRYFGTGTQKIEAELQKLFPKARLLRMDQDTVGGKRGHERIINQFRSKQYDILVGTQMVAKGHDIANVSAVGIVSADTSLHLPDFRAHERTYALLTQAAGRAGRGVLPGKVVVQTYNAQHYAIVCAQTADYKNYYAQETEWREALNYPPFAYLAKIVVRDGDEQTVDKLAGDIADKLKHEKIEIIGPAPALLARLNNEYRRVIILKAATADIINSVINAAEITTNRKVDIDIDPVSVI